MGCEALKNPRVLAVIIGCVALAGRFYGVYSSDLLEVVYSDYQVYDEQARNLLAGRGFWSDLEPERSRRGPLYPFFLAGIYSVFGPAYSAVRIVQCVLGAGTAVLIFLLASHLFHPRIGLWAGLGTALYPLLLLLPDGLMLENLLIPLCALLLFLLVRLSPGRTAAAAALIGLVLGLIALIRPISLVFPGYLALGLLALHGLSRWRETVKTCLIATLVMACVVAPWTIRNYRLHHRFIPVSTYEIGFWLSNNEHLQPGEVHANALMPLAERLGRENEMQAADYAREQVMRFIRTHPLAYVKLCLQRFISLWSPLYPFRPPFLKHSIPWAMLLIAAGAGGVLLRGSWRRVFWLYVLILWQVMSYIWFHAEPRYHLPMMPLLIILAAVAWDGLYAAGRRRLKALNTPAGADTRGPAASSPRPASPTGSGIP
jgi:4-amino-4-deoxy-L-arabinose transferase-like glycosyltransferase